LIKKEDQLILCKNCKNRNIDIPTGIFCNLYGDVPDFDIKCFDYEFSEKTEKYQHRKLKKKKKEKAIKENYSPKKDMLYGGLICLGGIIATLIDLGFIFYGAIIAGTLQFLKGAMLYNDKNF